MTSRDGIAVFHVASFNQNTTQQLVEDLDAVRRENGAQLRGIVLDLRGDPGGLLDQAVSLADLFIAKGPIIATVGRNPASHQYFEATGDSVAPHVRSSSWSTAARPPLRRLSPRRCRMPDARWSSAPPPTAKGRCRPCCGCPMTAS